ncbi:transposase [Tolypothrix sp. VBCCA 56010]|uniref:transposase n=1 Tax=Tolypothrix sp. VBCCA 56010 TaxID=3137731 RepID=UPI003D7E5711
MLAGNGKTFTCMVSSNQQLSNCFFWEFSHLDGTCFQDFLDLFSKAYPDALNLVQMDFCHFHKSLDLKWPDNIIPIFQPANSPELNPIERLWEHQRV